MKIPVELLGKAGASVCKKKSEESSSKKKRAGYILGAAALTAISPAIIPASTVLGITIGASYFSWSAFAGWTAFNGASMYLADTLLDNAKTPEPTPVV